MSAIHIDFSKIQEIAVKGVRRTAVFMGLGLNAMRDPEFKKYGLTGITELEFVPGNIDEETLVHFKTEFGSWIVANGLRELIETFSVFLDAIYAGCLWIALSCGQTTADKAKSRDKKFRYKGLSDKLTLLRDEFLVEVSDRSRLESINQARNCLTHRRGIVSIEDCVGGKELVVKWIGFDIYAETPSGEIVSLQPVPQEGIYLPDGGHIMLRFSEHTKSFPLRSLVTFTPRELSEICHFVLRMTGEIMQLAEIYARKSGVSSVSKVNVANETT